MPSKNDTRYKQIGGRHRALSRYYMLLNRVQALTKKNCRYEGVEVRVSKEDFVAWFMPRDFKGCSVDRKEKTGHYELSNMQVIPLSVNIAKDKVLARDGQTRCYACRATKPLEDFVRDNRRLTTGRSTICKPCEAVRKPKSAREDSYRGLFL